MYEIHKLMFFCIFIISRLVTERLRTLIHISNYFQFVWKLLKKTDKNEPYLLLLTTREAVGYQVLFVVVRPRVRRV